MPPTLNPWLVSYVSQHYQTKSRYEIDRYLIEAGYEPQEIEAVWQSLNPTPAKLDKPAQKWQRILKMGKALHRASPKQLLFGAATILVLFLAIVIIFDPILPILTSPHTKIQYGFSPTAKLSPNGKLLAVSTDKIEIWSMSDQKMQRAFGISVYNKFWWGNDSQYLASNPAEGNMQIWRVSDGVLVSRPENPLGKNSINRNTQISFNSANDMVTWPDLNDNNTKSWAVWRINEQNRTLIRNLTHSLYFNVLSQDKSLLAISDSAFQIEILRASDGLFVSLLYARTDRAISAIAFGLNDETFAFGTTGGLLQIWRISDNKTLTSFKPDREGIGKLAFSPDGQFLASTNSHPSGDQDIGTSVNDTSIKLWRVSDGTLIKKFEGHSDVIYDLLFSADGQTLVSTSRDNTLRFWPVK